MPQETKPDLTLLKFPKPQEPKANWTPIQLLEEFLEEIRTGKETPICLQVSWIEELPNGNRCPRFWHAGCTIAEQISFTELIKMRLINIWKGEE